MMSASTANHPAATGRTERIFIYALSLWILLQTSRAFAIVLLNDIDAGIASEAWRYPAYLDLFAVVFAFPLIWACGRTVAF